LRRRVVVVMSQLGQGSLRFPTTRLLEADYGAVLAKQVYANDHVRAVECTLYGRNEEGTKPILFIASIHIIFTYWGVASVVLGNEYIFQQDCTSEEISEEINISLNRQV